MNPTEEQAAVVRASVELAAGGGSIRVAAGAGTGKTATLRLIANTVGKNAKKLYLAYNRPIRDEAERIFGDDADVRTLHSLAYSDMGVGPSGRQLRWPSIREVQGLLGGRGKDFSLARAARQTLEAWCHSSDSKISAQHVPRAVDPSMASSAVEGAVYLLELLHPSNRGSRKYPLPHDLYLKCWGVAGAPSLARYDLVLLDEAQDCNPVILDALANARAVVYVGDRFQQIYDWRGTTNAMDLLDCPEYPLTQSFRWGPAIANVANTILAQRKLDPPKYLLRGDPTIESRVDMVDSRRPHARIYRQNLDLIADAVLMRSFDRPVQLVGDRRDLAGVLKAIESLRAGHVVKHPIVSAYQDWQDLIHSLSREKGAPSELSQAVNLVQEYGDNLEPVYKVLERVEGQSPTREDALIFTTAHRAKGREWREVVLGHDFQRALASSEMQKSFDMELNLLYVAITRASRVLDISQCSYLQELLQSA